MGSRVRPVPTASRNLTCGRSTTRREAQNRPRRKPGWQRNGEIISRRKDEGCAICRTDPYLRTVQDWTSSRSCAPCPEVRRRQNSLGGYVYEITSQPDPAKIYALGLSLADLAGIVEHANTIAGRGLCRTQRRGSRRAQPGRLEFIDDIAKVVVSTRGAPVELAMKTSRRWVVELRAAHGQRHMNGEEVVIGTAPC